MKGKKIAVFGLGRSGLAVARAAQSFGSEVVAYDENPREAAINVEAVEALEGLGVPIAFEWDGDPTDTGAEVIVVNPAIDQRNPKLAKAIAAGMEVMSEVEFAYRVSNAPIVAITGTNGKSTTTVMTYLALKACRIDAVLCGNIFGSGYDEVPLTEAALNSKGDQVLVAEVSSFQLEWVKSFRPVVAAITNISPDHMDRYDNFEQYSSTKHRIFSRQTPDDYAVINGDDPLSQPWRKTQSWLGFGRKGEHARSDKGYLMVGTQSMPLSVLPFKEPHNLVNAGAAGLLAAAALRHRLGVRGHGPISPPAEILTGLAQFRGLSHRMELVGEKRGIRVVNNSMCTNPAAVVASASSVQGPLRLIMGGISKGLDFAPVCEFVRKSGAKPYLFGRDAKIVAEAMGVEGPIFETMDAAFAVAANAAESGDTILLAPGCASMDQFRDFRDRGDVFKQVAREWLDRP